MTANVHTSEAMVRRLAKRRSAERRFRACGIIAITLAIAALAALFASIVGNGYTAFQQTYIKLEVTYDPEVLGLGDARNAAAVSAANYSGLVKKTLRDMFPEVKGRKAKRALYGIVSSGASFMLRERVLADPGLIGRTERIRVPADDDLDMLVKGHIDRAAPESERRASRTTRLRGSRRSKRRAGSRSGSTPPSSPPATRASRSSRGSGAPRSARSTPCS